MKTRNTLTLLVLMLFFSSFAWGQTIIDNSYFSSNLTTYQWDLGGSPYLIMDNINIPDGSELIIKPDVEVLFQGHYYINVKGSINAIGYPTKRIVFTSDAGFGSWNGIRFDFSDNPNPAPSKLHYCDISNASKTGTTCTSPDPESSGGAIYVESFSDLEIFECDIFNNHVLGHGGAIALFSNSNPSIEKSLIHSNYAKHRGGGISAHIHCSPDIIGNSIYKNESAKGGGAIFIGPLYCLRGSNTGDYNKILNNLFVENHATDKGVVYLQGDNRKTIFNHNTISNNTYTPPGFISGVCIDLDQNKPDEFKNNIIYESIVDILVMYGNYAYQHPSNYYTTLIHHNHLNEKYDQNFTPPYVLNASPGFVSGTDYHLASSSPCIDPLGSDNNAMHTNTDLDGNQRIVNKTDYGCYEYGSTPPARKARPISNSEENQISIYPNPASDFLIIKTTSEQNLNISIYSLSGQRVYISENNTINGEKNISLSELKAGVYFMELQTLTETIKKKLIIK